MILRDGSTVHVRPVREDDRAAMADFFGGLTPDSRGLRFFSAAANVEQEAERAVDVDYADRYGLIATRGEDGHPVGHSAYYRSSRASRDRVRGGGRAAGPRPGHDPARPPGRDGRRAGNRDLRGRGAAGEPPHDRGVPGERLSGRGAVGARIDSGRAADVVQLRGAWSGSRIGIEARPPPRWAASSSRGRWPSSGHRGRRDTVGGQIFHNLLDAGFEGTAYPVNREAEVVQSVRAYRSVSEIPGPIDLAVVAVPAAAVIDVVRECAGQGVPAVVVISAGFAEVGPEGAERQRRAARGLPRGRCAAGRAQLPRRRQHRRRRAAECDLRSSHAGAGQRRLRLAERCARAGVHRALRRSQPGPVLVRVGGKPRRHHGQRPARVLGVGPRHRRGAALHRVVQRSAALLAGGAPGRQGEADRRREERPLGRRGPGRPAPTPGRCWRPPT